MDKIYALAHSVRIWLGSATDEEVDSIWPMFSASSDDPYYESRTQIDKRKTWLHALDETTSTSRLLKRFFNRAWFTRRWILQEVVLAREVVVHYGLHEVTWHRFYRGAHVHYLALLHVQSKHGDCNLATVASQVLDTIETLENSRIQTKKYALFKGELPETQMMKALQLLELYHTAECVDERDRLYALYGVLLNTILPAEQDPKLMRLCPVDYSDHFSHLYTNLAIAAIESGYLSEVLTHAIEFGTLWQQDEAWPSWVPSWNVKRELNEAADSLRLATHNPHFGPNIRDHPPDIRFLRWIKLGTEDGTKCDYVHSTKALHVRGSFRRICEVQPSTCSLDVLAFLHAMLDRQCAGHSFAISRYVVAWLVMLILTQVRRVLPRPGLDAKTYLTSNPFYHNMQASYEHETYVALQTALGLPSEESTESMHHLDQDNLLSEVRRVLQGLYPFRYEHDGSPAFGIAFAEVKTGDFVFRTAQVYSQKNHEGDTMSPVSGFVIRPCHQASAVGPATFRLVGMCYTYYPDMKDPEFVEVILV